VSWLIWTLVAIAGEIALALALGRWLRARR
jgi:hypothetical protein